MLQLRKKSLELQTKITKTKVQELVYFDQISLLTKELQETDKLPFKEKQKSHQILEGGADYQEDLDYDAKSSVPVVPCRVHHHSYASQVAYLRLTNSNLAAQCSFNMGKSGLSPQKLVMIPRVELSCFPPDLTE